MSVEELRALLRPSPTQVVVGALSTLATLGVTAVGMYIAVGGDPADIWRAVVGRLTAGLHVGCLAAQDQAVEAATRRGYDEGWLAGHRKGVEEMACGSTR